LPSSRSATAPSEQAGEAPLVLLAAPLWTSGRTLRPARLLALLPALLPALPAPAEDLARTSPLAAAPSPAGWPWLASCCAAG
jgi:hypothetical protein